MLNHCNVCKKEVPIPHHHGRHENGECVYPEYCIIGLPEKCKQIGELSRINEIKSFTCLELPVKYIHKPVGEWMCTVCAKNLLSGSEDF